MMWPLRHVIHLEVLNHMTTTRFKRSLGENISPSQRTNVPSLWLLNKHMCVKGDTHGTSPWIKRVTRLFINPTCQRICFHPRWPWTLSQQLSSWKMWTLKGLERRCLECLRPSFPSRVCAARLPLVNRAECGRSDRHLAGHTYFQSALGTTS